MKVMAVRADQKGLDLNYSIEPEVPDVLVGDAGRLRQVLVNLLGNAIKFTERGQVAVQIGIEEAIADEVWLHFTVSDTGIGVPAEKQHMIFDAFAQTDSSISRKYGGTGLGLAISARLVEMMGGRIGVESPANCHLWIDERHMLGEAFKGGPGSTFSFTSRFGLQHAAEITSIPAQQEDPPLPDLDRRLHILLAEDNAVNQLLIVRLLEKRGHSVVVARDGREALKLLDHHRFELVLMDVQMPELNGFEVTAVIRQKEAAIGGHLPIIALTAHAMKGDQELCIAAGMDAYLSKPIHSAELFDIIGRLASREVTEGVPSR
jgi:CheY-like chemotaxis protein